MLVLQGGKGEKRSPSSPTNTARQVTGLHESKMLVPHGGTAEARFLTDPIVFARQEETGQSGECKPHWIFPRETCEIISPFLAFF